MKNTFANQVSNQRHWLVLPKLSVAPVIALLLIMAAVLPGTIAAQSISNDATLSALTVSPKNIIGFEAERTAYDVGVASTVTQATVTATANDSGASVSNTPADAKEDAPGHQVALSSGANTVTIAVTAEDTTTTETYTVRINRGVTDAVQPAPPGLAVWPAAIPLTSTVASLHRRRTVCFEISLDCGLCISDDRHLSKGGRSERVGNYCPLNDCTVSSPAGVALLILSQQRRDSTPQVP